MELKRRYEQNISYLEYAQGTWGGDEAVMNHEASSLFSTDTPESIMNRVEELQEQEVAIRHDIDEAEKNVGRLEPWGNFNWADIRRLEEATGLKV
jgi:hypothetical protein